MDESTGRGEKSIHNSFTVNAIVCVALAMNAGHKLEENLI